MSRTVMARQVRCALVLGWLFSTVDFVERRSELVFIVTPQIVRDPMVKPESTYADEADVEQTNP